MLDIDRRDRWTAFRLVGVQAMTVVVLAGAGRFFGVEQMLALLIGGMIGVAGSAWLAFFAFRPSGTRSAKVILVSFYLGEIGKVLILASLFIVVFRHFDWLREPQRALLVFVGFLAGQFASLLVPRLLWRR
jgi:ATP synthase protein I